MRVRRDREGGAALVEFALIVPLLTLFLFGIVQFGLAYDKKQSINAAAREGSRTGAIPANTVSQIRDAAENSFDGLLDGTVVTKVYLDDPDTNPEITDPTNKPCEGNAGRTVVVISVVEHVLTIPFFGAPTLDLEGRGEFRCERA